MLQQIINISIVHTVLAGLLIITSALCPAGIVSAATDEKPWLSRPLSNADARHLLSRTGFGVSVSELNTIRGLSRTQAIDHILQGFLQTAEQAMPAWTQKPAPLYWTRKDLNREQQRRFDRRRDTELVELRQWWVNTMLTTSSPQTERMVLFWHDHFATSYKSINRQSMSMARQNQTFRRLAMGDFKTLVKAMIRDPGLLNYLDNINNRKVAPNENLARELLELFTLGEGNYDEHTVRESARALTGFSVSQNRNLSFEFKTWSHDTGSKTLFGKTANFNGDGLIDEVFNQPALAKFIATKFWHAFIADYAPSQKQVDLLAKAFADNQFKVSALYRATLESREFWSDQARASLVKSPAQLIVGFARATQYPQKLNQQIPSLLARSGMDLFAPPNVSGWSEGAAWITSGRLLNRYSAIESLASGGYEPLSPATGMAMNAMSSNSNQMAMAPNTMNAMNNSMTAPDSPPDESMKRTDATITLDVSIAAENYQGPVKYRIELLSSDENIIWSSGDQLLHGGHDTAIHGRIRNVQDLPWQTLSFAIADATVTEAQQLKIHFLNDNAGADGDRNLYINGVRLNKQWIDSSLGIQTSKCTPATKADAGNLYCAGSISLALNKQLHTSKPALNQSQTGLRASSVHVHWVRWNKKHDNLDLTLTLQNLHHDNKTTPVFSFHLKSINAGEPQLELQSYGCWPECVDQWPDCSWSDTINPDRKALVFRSSVAINNEDLKCHFDSLSASEKTLMKNLMANAPALLAAATNTSRSFSPPEIKAIERWQKLLQTHRRELSNWPDQSTTVSTAETLRLDPTWHAATSERWLSTPLAVSISTIDELQQSLSDNGISLTQLLLPGIEETQFEGLDDLQKLPLTDQLISLINHPVFQLH